MNETETCQGHSILLFLSSKSLLFVFFNSEEGLGIFCARNYFINNILFNALANNISYK